MSVHRRVSQSSFPPSELPDAIPKLIFLFFELEEARFFWPLRAIDWSLGVAHGVVGWTTFYDDRVDGIVEDVATSTLATTLGGMVGEGMDWSGKSGDVRR